VNGTHTGSPWAVILGGSSGFGLATARKLGQHGMNLCIVHRDRRGAMGRIEAQFDEIRATGANLLTFNRNALDPAQREAIVDALSASLGTGGKVRLLMHSIAFGNLKPLGPPPQDNATPAQERLATALGISRGRLADAVDQLLTDGVDALHAIASPPPHGATGFLTEEDFALTIHSMGTSLIGWAQELVGRKLFTDDARILSMTSEGNTVAWPGYAAVSTAKAALEAASRSLATEFAPYGIRTNIIQAGITDTPALRLIPGHQKMKAAARRRNPFHRLTTPADIAQVVYLLCRDEAAWINGTVIRVDGGEHISGLG